MPDFDIIRGLPTGTFLKYLNHLQDECVERVSTNEELSIDALLPMKKRLQTYGNVSLEYLDTIADHIESNAHEMSQPGYNWNSSRRYLDAVASAHKFEKSRTKAYSKKAANDVYNEIRQTGMSNRPRYDLVYAYLKSIYVGELPDVMRIAPESENYKVEAINELLSELQPLVEEKLHIFAEQLEKSGDVEQLRMPSRKKPVVTLETVFSVER